jgi:hypothetical protein
VSSFKYSLGDEDEGDAMRRPDDNDDTTDAREDLFDCKI